MFTHATRHFGIWRENHVGRRRFAGNPTANFVVALGMACFVSWLIFFLILKIRVEFFLVESASFPLAEAPEGMAGLHKAVPVALVAAVLPGENGETHVVLGEGKHFVLPDEQLNLTDYLRTRQRRIELQTMVTKSFSPAVSRVQIWAARSLPASSLEMAAGVFVQAGFDGIELAARVRGGEH